MEVFERVVTRDNLTEYIGTDSQSFVRGQIPPVLLTRY